MGEAKLANRSQEEASELLREILGDAYNELIRVLLDLDEAPIFMFNSRHDRVKRVVADCHERVASELPSHQGAATKIHAQMSPAVRSSDLAKDLLIWGTDWDYFAIHEGHFSATSPESPVWRAFPKLVAQLGQKDGLLPVEGLSATPCGLLHEGHLVYFHQFFRRGFGSSILIDFTSKLLQVHQSRTATLRMAVDEFRVCPEEEDAMRMELDHWYGTPISEEFLDDPHRIGETVHGDPEQGNGPWHNYSHLAVQWTVDGPLKTVQMQERVSARALGSNCGYYLVRYLHAIRDIRLKQFVHCDGAVKAYSQEDYLAEEGKPFPSCATKHYRKVFRLDGLIETKLWSEIAAFWFRGNPLILEYLQGVG